MARMKIEMQGFEELMDRLQKAGAEINDVTEKALEEAHKAVTPDIETAIAKHHLTGETEESLTKDAEIEWSGLEAAVKVGFRIKDGGLPSIFLMYGTPKMSPDKSLYNAIYGSAAKRKIKEAQEEVLFNELWGRTL